MQNFLDSIGDAKYLLLFTPYNNDGLNYTTPIIVNKREGLLESILDAIEHIGKVEDYTYDETCFNFYIRGKMYSLVDWTNGVIEN